jgi:KaiC/GvpD/RAD55 family RecA-like ATPase
MARNQNGDNLAKVTMDLQVDTLNTIISYLFTQNPNITRRSLTGIKSFFDILDTRVFENDESMMARIHFIKQVLHCRLQLGIQEYSLILEHTRGGVHDDEIVNSIIPDVEEGFELSTEEVRYINNFVAERLKYSYLFSLKGPILDNFEKLEIGDYESIQEINHILKMNIMQLVANMRKAEVEDENSQYLDLTPENFRNMVTEIVNDLRKPTNYLKSGLQYLNEMLVGGFEAGRFYLFLGASGGFKSGILLSIVKWIRQYNKGIQTKDPNKKPCVLYVTQENSLRETVERLFNLSVSGDDIRNYTPDEVIEMLLGDGGLDIEVNNINIRLVYKPNRSISTDDLYSMMDEIEEEGYEIIALVHDYVKRIRAANPSKELRIELGNIVDEMTVIAKTRNIVVVSASQLNREGIKIIEAAVESGQQDIGKKLGSSNTGESWAMIENSDWVCIINREYKQSTNTWYLSFKQVKTRAKNPTLTYFAHPFEQGNGMKLIEDVNLKEPKSLKVISDDVMSGSTVASKGRVSARKRSKVEDSDEEETDSAPKVILGGDDDLDLD